MTNILTNEKVYKVIDISKCVYLCIFTLYLVVREVYALNYFIDNFYITGFFTAAALLFIGYDVLTNRFCFKTRYFTVAILFIVITVISCVLNREYGVFSNLKGLTTLGIYLFLLYPEAFKDKSNRTLSACLHTGFFSMTFFSLASLPMYIYNINYLCNKNGEPKDQGFVTRLGRLWGVFQDPNYLALFSLIAICSSVFIFARSKSIFKKVVLILLDLIHVIVLSMTGSKMGYVITVAALCWLSIIVIFKKLSIKIIYRILAFMLAVAISLAAPILISKSVSSFMPLVKKTVVHAGSAETYMNVHLFYDKIFSSGDLELTEGSAEELDMSKFPFDSLNSPVNRVDKPEEISNGRFERWIDGLKLIAEQPFFGLSPRNILSFADKNDTDTLMNTMDATIHNTYLELFAGAGIIGGIIIFIFLIFAAVYVIKTALKFTPSVEIAISTTLILIIALSAILLPDIIFFQLTFAGLIFWLCLGNCLNTDEEGYKKSLTYKLITKCFKRKTES